MMLHQQILQECSSRLRLLEPRELLEVRPNRASGDTGLIIREMLRELPRLSDSIAVSYFAHSEISRTGGGYQP